MANTLGSAQGDLILQEALSMVFTKRPLLRAITLDTSDANTQGVEAKLGQTVITRTRAVSTVADFNSGAGNYVATDVPVVLSNFKEVHHQFTAAEYNSTDRDLIREVAEPIAIGMANHMVDAVAALWTTINFGNTASATDDHAQILALQSALDAAGVPEGQRFHAFNSTVKAGYNADTTIVAEQNNALNANAVATGKVPVVAGFSMHDYPSLGALAENRSGFAGTKESVVLATRVPTNPETLIPNLKADGIITYMTEPATGMTVMINQWIDMQSLAANTRIVWMYGVAKGDAAQGTVLTTA